MGQNGWEEKEGWVKMGERRMRRVGWEENEGLVKWVGYNGRLGTKGWEENERMRQTRDGRRIRFGTKRV